MQGEVPTERGLCKAADKSSLACEPTAGENRDMSRYHLVRVGAMGQVGRFAAVDAVRYPRRSRVIVRTRRGLEIGDVLRRPKIATTAARLPTATCFAA